MDKKAETRAYAAPAVDRMLDIVEFLAENCRTYGVTELARELRISTNSVFRIMKRLVERGYVRVDPDSGGYQLGLRFMSLGMRLSHRHDLRGCARPYLESLARDTGMMAQLHVVDDKRLVVLDAAQPPAEYFMQVVPGSEASFHCSAMGKCILAFLPDEEMHRLLPRRLPRFSENTITSFEKLEEELRTVARTGIAYDREEHLRGVFCVGSPVFNLRGDVAAGVGVTGLAGWYPEDEREPLALRVRETAREVSEELGYTENAFNAFAKNAMRGGCPF